MFFEEQSNRGGNALIHLDKKRKSFNSQISNEDFCFDYFRRIKERGGGEDGGRRRRDEYFRTIIYIFCTNLLGCEKSVWCFGGILMMWTLGISFQDLIGLEMRKGSHLN